MLLVMKAYPGIESTDGIIQERRLVFQANLRQLIYDLAGRIRLRPMGYDGTSSNLDQLMDHQLVLLREILHKIYRCILKVHFPYPLHPYTFQPLTLDNFRIIWD